MLIVRGAHHKTSTQDTVSTIEESSAIRIPFLFSFFGVVFIDIVFVYYYLVWVWKLLLHKGNQFFY